MSKSGAMLAYNQYFSDRQLDVFIKYVKDHDLRQSKLFKSREMKTGIYTDLKWTCHSSSMSNLSISLTLILESPWEEVRILD